MAFLSQKIPFGKSVATQPNQVDIEIIPHDDNVISSITEKERKLKGMNLLDTTYEE